MEGSGREKGKCFISVHKGVSYQIVDSLREKISCNLEKYNIRVPSSVDAASSMSSRLLLLGSRLSISSLARAR